MITPTISKTALTKYELASRDWSVAFFDELENHVGTDVRSGESLSLLATQEYIVALPLASVTKALTRNTYLILMNYGYSAV